MANMRAVQVDEIRKPMELREFPSPISAAPPCSCAS